MVNAKPQKIQLFFHFKSSKTLSLTNNKIIPIINYYTDQTGGPNWISILLNELNLPNQ